jgi:hypothetical protein
MNASQEIGRIEASVAGAMATKQPTRRAGPSTAQLYRFQPEG